MCFNYLYIYVMNKKKALELEKELKGQIFNGYLIIEYINNGKSAAVFKAEKDGNNFAVKIFDNELVENFGHEIQEKRIEQELSLKEHNVPNLIKIIDGGQIKCKGEEYHYMVMEFLSGKNLKQYIEIETYSEEVIKKVLSSLYETSEILINQYQIAHRDIKPENIMIDEQEKITLMDLGVLKYINTLSFSDGNDEKAFVGTLRYAPPEFILRQEKDNAEAWRAINLYQIGGVLHDMITKKELFYDKTPYPNLVRAILEDTPEFVSKEYSSQLVQLTRNLFIKTPEIRLRISVSPLVTYLKESVEEGSVEDILKKHKELYSQNKLKTIEIDELRRTDTEKREIRTRYLSEITSIVKQIVSDFTVSDNIIGDCETGENYRLKVEIREASNVSKAVINLPFKIRKNLTHGFPQPFYFSVGIKVDESKLASISCVAFYGGESPFNFKEDLNNFEGMIFQAINPNLPINSATNIYLQGQSKNNFDPLKIFDGIYSNDEGFKKTIKASLLKILLKAKDIGKNDVEIELEQQQNYYRTEKKTLGQKTIKLATMIANID